MKKLTDAAVRAILRNPPSEREALVDGTVPGLQLRAGPGGATWSLKLRVSGEGGISSRGHRVKGKQHRLSLGEYPAVSIQAARSRANTYIDQAKQGISPVVALEGQATAGGLTVKALSERFITDYVQMKQLRALRKYTMAIEAHILPQVGSVLADVLSREQVRRLVKTAMVRRTRGTSARARPRGGNEAARTALGVLRKMINWGMREELIARSENPATGMEDNLPKKKKKERVLSLDEARLAWRAAESLGYPFGPTYQLILLTGCRPGEWAESRRPWIDLKQALMVIPADGYKTEHVHVVPLVPAAVRILEQVLTNHHREFGDFIFSGTDGKKPLSGWSKAQARMLKAICAMSGERTALAWTPHDLRRTVATRIAEQLGVGGEQLIKRVLGHSDGSVTAIYNRYGYVKEMRAVLERWAVELTRVDSRNVTSVPSTIAAAA